MGPALGGRGTREGAYCLNLLFQRFGAFHLCFYGESSLKVMFELKAVFIICFAMLSILQLHIEFGSPVSPEGSYFLIPLYPTLWCSICQYMFASAGADKVETAT